MEKDLNNQERVVQFLKEKCIFSVEDVKYNQETKTYDLEVIYPTQFSVTKVQVKAEDLIKKPESEKDPVEEDKKRISEEEIEHEKYLRDNTIYGKDGAYENPEEVKYSKGLKEVTFESDGRKHKLDHLYVDSNDSKQIIQIEAGDNYSLDIVTNGENVEIESDLGVDIQVKKSKYFDDLNLFIIKFTMPELKSETDRCYIKQTVTLGDEKMVTYSYFRNTNDKNRYYYFNGDLWMGSVPWGCFYLNLPPERDFVIPIPTNGELVKIDTDLDITFKVEKGVCKTETGELVEGYNVSFTSPRLYDNKHHHIKFVLSKGKDIEQPYYCGYEQCSEEEFKSINKDLVELGYLDENYNPIKYWEE